MPSSLLDIWNLAISNLGEAVEVNAQNENTAAARACRRFYDLCREKALRDAPWPFATKYALLAQVTQTLPPSEFQYAYRYPSDALMIRRLLNGISRVDNKQSRIPYRIAQDSGGWLVLTDAAPVISTDASLSVPYAQYTVNVSDSSVFSADFVMALSYLLARSIGPRISGDNSKLVQNCMVMYEREITKAKINAFNEEAEDDETSSEFERARTGWLETISTKLL